MRYTVCTTFDVKKHYNAYGKTFLETFDGYWDRGIELFVYLDHEGYWDERVDLDPDRIYKVMDSRRFVDWKRDHTDPVHNGWRNGVYDFKRDAVRFSHKVFTIRDCFRSLKESGRFPDYLVWLDADVVTHELVTTEWLDNFAPGENELFSYLNRRFWPETGFIVFNMRNEHTLGFINQLYETYLNGHVFDMRECHDAYVIWRQILEWEADGHKFKKLGDDGLGDGAHVFILSKLGERMDHLKGLRKNKGRSEKRDMNDTEHFNKEYWRIIKHA